MPAYRSGFIAITGRPNVGKSTLLNSLTGEKVAIVSNKPQTTRNQIRGVLTRENFQAAFIDTPGIHEPKHKLGGYMVKTAEAAIGEVDAFLFLADADLKHLKADSEILSRFVNIKTPAILAINKIDTVPKPALLTVIEGYEKIFDFAEIIPVSALTGENLAELTDSIVKYLPEGPKFFPDDYYTDQPERFVISEIIREKALLFLQDEIPHGIAVETTKVKREKGMMEVSATIYCEKDSHKGIIIGGQGAMLKKIGQRARAEIEALLGEKIFLETWVKVKKDWRDNEFLLKQFGYGRAGK